MQTAVVVRGVVYLDRDFGPGTAMDAEWLALLRAVEIAQQLQLDEPLFLGDALAVIEQARGTVKCRPEFAHHRCALPASGTPLRLRYIKREQNLAGIALERARDRS